MRIVLPLLVLLAAGCIRRPAAETFDAAICFAGLVFVWLKVPETKGKTLEQNERELVD